MYDKSGIARRLLLAEGKRRSLPAHNKRDEPDQLSGYCLSQLPDRCSGIILNIHYKIEYYPSICQPAFGWLFFGRHRPDFSFFSRSLNLPRFCAKRALNVSRLCGPDSATRASRCAWLRILTAKISHYHYLAADMQRSARSFSGTGRTILDKKSIAILMHKYPRFPGDR